MLDAPRPLLEAAGYVGLGLALDRVVGVVARRVVDRLRHETPSARRLALVSFAVGACSAAGPLAYALWLAAKRAARDRRGTKPSWMWERDFDASPPPIVRTKGNGDDDGSAPHVVVGADDAETNDGLFSIKNVYDREMQERTRKAVMEEMAIKRTSVTVRVPATSANLGPGFDCLGMALDMWSELTVSRANAFSIESSGEGADQVPQDETNLCCMGVKKAFEVAGEPVPPLAYVCKNRIPFARGLGSSSAAIVAGLIAGLVLTGHKLTCWGEESLLQLAAAIEGHPDNVSPAIYGGVQLGIHTGSRWMSERVTVPAGMQVVVFIPDTIGKTSDARAVLSQTVRREDAVFNVGRAAWLVNALNMQRFDHLAFGAQDRLHQPQRADQVYPHLYPLIDAATKAGGSAAFLSGAGPSVLAFTSGASGDIFAQREKERVDTQVAKAMLAAAQNAGVNGQVFITEPVETGAHVVHAEPPYSTKLMKYRGDV